MKVTLFSDLVLKNEVRAIGSMNAVVSVSDATTWVKNNVVIHYRRSPLADELVAVDRVARFYNVMERPVWSCNAEGTALFTLSTLGVHPTNPFLVICSRTDSGPFWRAVAIAKYKLLLAECKLTQACFQSLYLWGLVVIPLGEEFSWRHLRLDWLLILNAIALLGLIGCSFAWFWVGAYWQVASCLIVSLVGATGLGSRRNHLIAVRDRELRKVALRELFRLHGVTPTPEEFRMCTLELLNPFEVISRHQDAQIEEPQVETSTLCYYYQHNPYLQCAVHPGRDCESCGDYRPV
jgi:hypothetical protein